VQNASVNSLLLVHWALLPLPLVHPLQLLPPVLVSDVSWIDYHREEIKGEKALLSSFTLVLLVSALVKRHLVELVEQELKLQGLTVEVMYHFQYFSFRGLHQTPLSQPLSVAPHAISVIGGSDLMCGE
jgi:hypothetical protein